MTLPPLLYRLVAVTVLAHLAFTGCRICLSLFAIRLGGSAWTAGLLMSLLALLPMFLAVHAGRWTDRIGVRQPSRFALGAMACGVLLPWLWPTVEALYVASVVIGTSFMVFHVALTNAAGRASGPDNRRQAFTLVGLGFSASTICGPVVAGVAIDHVGHARTFALLGLFTLAALFCVRYLGHSDALAGHADGPRQKVNVLDLLRMRRLRAVFLIGALLSMSWDLFTFMMPVQGARIGLSASTIGVIMGTFGAATLVVRLAMGWLARHATEWQILTVALANTALVYALFPFFSDVPVLMALAFLLGLGLGSTQPMVMSLLHHEAPAGRTGEAVGVRTTLMNASATVLPLLFGALGTTLGLGPAFWTLALLLSGGSLFAGRHQRHAA